MPKKQEWTVRVVNYRTVKVRDFSQWGNYLAGPWVDMLRYMGMAQELASYDDRTVIEFYCPNSRGIDTKVWAEQNAARMRSFSIDAAAAPKWTGDEVVLSNWSNPDTLADVRMRHMERFNRPRT